MSRYEIDGSRDGDVSQQIEQLQEDATKAQMNNDVSWAQQHLAEGVVAGHSWGQWQTKDEFIRDLRQKQQVEECTRQALPRPQLPDIFSKQKFVFPSLNDKGTIPLYASTFVADYLRPAAVKGGVKIVPGQRFGLHNLRHS